MELGKSVLMKLAKMICGDEPYSFFPYRSSSLLTEFFTTLDLDYVHDGSTRRNWVYSALLEIEGQDEPHDDLPSKKVRLIVEELVSKEHFMALPTENHEKAIEAVNILLSKKGLKLIDYRGSPSVTLYSSDFVSTEGQNAPQEQVITFAPQVFNIPEKPLDSNLISVMMPFAPEFQDTYNAIQRVAEYMNLKCYRADNIWNNSSIIQDIFELIYCSRVVVADFSTKNPNVMYETGIAHTLGKVVIPIARSIDDIPFDLKHHRVLIYHPHHDGYRNLSNQLWTRFQQFWPDSNQGVAT